MSVNICYFCGTRVNSLQSFVFPVMDVISVNCPICGRYSYTGQFEQPEYKDYVAAYLYHHEKSSISDNNLLPFLGTKEELERVQDSPDIRKNLVTINEIKAFYPRRFTQRIEMSLLAIAKKSNYFGKVIEVSDDEIQSLFFIRRFNEQGEPQPIDDIKNQYITILKHFQKAGYIEYQGKQNSTRIELQAEGWKAIEKYQSNEALNHNVFVAMSFDPSQNEVWEAIKQGVINAEFSPEIMKEIIHNKEIVPEMFRLIRECRFLIMDISDPNYGAYYEAGYALGFGKEIIITCSQEIYNKEYTTEEERRHLKPHFDIAQKQILVWKDYNDLTKKLEQWIRALFT